MHRFFASLRMARVPLAEHTIKAIFALIGRARAVFFRDGLWGGWTASCPRPAGQFGAARNQARAAFIREIGPCPLDEHQHAIAESDEKKDVHEKPRHPGDKSGNVKLTDFSNGRGAADRRKVALVVVMKR